MKQWEIQVEREWDSDAIGGAIEAIFRSRGLTRSLKGTLRAYRGCVHWHFKKAKQSGTIEATMWPGERRVWLSVQAGRAAEWIELVVPEIRKDLGAAMKKKIKRPRD